MAEVIRFDVSQALRNLEQLPRAHRRAVSRGLNKAAGNVRTAASAAIRKKRSLSAKVVREALAIRRASATRLVASIVVTGRPIPLRDYKANQTKRGVTVLVTPGKRTLVQHRGNRAFVIGKLSNHVFAREGKSRLPVKKLYGPSLPSAFLQQEVRAAWTETAQEALPKRITEEIRYELNRLEDRATAKRGFR